MNPMLFYIGALALCAAAFVLIRQAAAAAPSKAKLRLAGRLLLGIAASFAGIGVLAQAISSSH